MNTFKAQDRQSHEQERNLSRFRTQERTLGSQDLSITFDSMVLSNPESHKCASSAIESYASYSKLVQEAVDFSTIEQESLSKFVLDGVIAVTVSTGVFGLLMTLSTSIISTF